MGRVVVTMCKKNKTRALRSRPGIINNTPISISNRPNNTMNTLKGIKGIVMERRLWTIGLAGLKPITFSSPNQK